MSTHEVTAFDLMASCAIEFRKAFPEDNHVLTQDQFSDWIDGWLAADPIRSTLATQHGYWIRRPSKEAANKSDERLAYLFRRNFWRKRLNQHTVKPEMNEIPGMAAYKIDSVKKKGFIGTLVVRTAHESLVNDPVRTQLSSLIVTVEKRLQRVAKGVDVRKVPEAQETLDDILEDLDNWRQIIQQQTEHMNRRLNKLETKFRPLLGKSAEVLLLKSGS